MEWLQILSPWLAPLPAPTVFGEEMIATILVNLVAHGMTLGGSLAEPEDRGIMQPARGAEHG